jgi:hypothetical protein
VREEQIERFTEKLKQIRPDVQLVVSCDRAFLSKEETSYVLCSVYDLHTFTNVKLKKIIGEWFPLEEKEKKMSKITTERDARERGLNVGARFANVFQTKSPVSTSDMMYLAFYFADIEGLEGNDLNMSFAAGFASAFDNVELKMKYLEQDIQS